MSLYREPRGRSMRIAGVAALSTLLLGALGGFAVGRATGDDPSLASALAELQRNVRPARGELELVVIEYRQAGTESEYQAARSHVERAREIFAGAREQLSVLAPDETRRAESALARLAELVDARAPLPQLEEEARAADHAIAAAARLQAVDAG